MPNDFMRLEGELAEAVFGAYQFYIRESFGDHPALKGAFQFGPDNPQNAQSPRVVMGDAIPGLIVLNSVLETHGLRVARGVELMNNYGFVQANSGSCSPAHFGVALFTGGGPNQYIAGRLAQQIPDKKLPLIIPVDQLEADLDGDSPSGLAFRLTGNDVFQDIPGDKFNFSKWDSRGIPTDRGAGSWRWMLYSPGEAEGYCLLGANLSHFNEVEVCGGIFATPFDSDSPERQREIRRQAQPNYGSRVFVVPLL